MGVPWFPFANKSFSAELADLRCCPVVNPRCGPYFIRHFACHLPKVFEAAFTLLSLLMMGCVACALHNYQILKTVIISYSVNMMDYLVRLKGSPNGLLHKINMLSNISAVIRPGVRRRLNKNIPGARCLKFTAIPVCVKFPPKLMSADKWSRKSLNRILIPIRKTTAPASAGVGLFFEALMFSVHSVSIAFSSLRLSVSIKDQYGAP